MGKGKRKKSLRAVARALRLPSHAQLSRMLSGALADTPAMKAALLRADARARRTWAFAKDDEQPAVDAALVMESIQVIERELAVLKALVTR